VSSNPKIVGLTVASSVGRLWTVLLPSTGLFSETSPKLLGNHKISSNYLARAHKKMEAEIASDLEELEAMLQ